MMTRVGIVAVGVAVALAMACELDSVPEPTPSPSPSVGADHLGSAEAPVCGTSELLPAPFTAKQIRDEWVPGFELIMRRQTPAGVSFERWRVVAADLDGVEIEYTPVDGGGDQIGEPATRTSAWTELRDHASYPAASATRSREVRETPRGRLTGWRYMVEDSDAGTVSELFFADAMPGAPVEMTVRRDGQPVLELAQVERSRPATPAQE